MMPYYVYPDILNFFFLPDLPTLRIKSLAGVKAEEARHNQTIVREELSIANKSTVLITSRGVTTLYIRKWRRKRPPNGGIWL